MADSLQLKVVLDLVDKAGGKLRGIIDASSGAAKKLAEARQQMKRLEDQQRSIAAHRGLEAKLGRDSTALQDARTKLKAMAAAIAATEAPTKSLTRAFDKQLTQVGKLAQRHREQRDALRKSSAALNASGIETNRLGVHEQRLAREIAAANKQIDGQKARLARLASVQERAQRMHSGGMVAAAHGAGLAYGGVRALQGMSGAMQPGMDLEARMRDISITGGLNRQQESALAAQVRTDAMTFGQTTDMISEGLSSLVANGITAQQDLARYSGLLAKSSVASGAEVGDLSNLIVSLQRNLGLTSSQISGALDSLAYAGKEGSFELRDMAKWMPLLAPMMASLGVTGRDAVDQLGAALQVARLGAGTSDEAGNNLANFLGKVVAPDTLRNFQRAGIDLKRRLMELQAQGVNPLQGSLQVITEYMGKKGPAAMRQLQAAMAIQNDEQRQAALEQLSSAYALGELFRDRQAMAFIRPALMNAPELARIREGAAGASGTLDRDYRNRDDTSGRNIERLKIALNELKLEAYDVMKANLGDWAGRLADGVNRLMAFAKAHPALVAGMMKFAAAIAVAAVAIGGLLVAGGTAAMMLGNILKVVTQLTGGRGFGWLASQGLQLLPRFFGGMTTLARGAIAALTGVSAPVLLVGALVASVALLIWKYWKPIKAFMIGVVQGIGDVLSPLGAQLKEAVAPLAPVFATLGGWLNTIWGVLKEMLTPFQATNAELAAATGYGRTFGQVLGTVVYANLRLVIGAISGLVQGIVWVGTKIGELAAGMVTSIGAVNDIIKGVFTLDGAAIMAGFQALWLNVNQFFGGLPAKFMTFGINMVQGLVNGITSMLGAPGKALANVANGAIARLKNLLGIHSPSRVFAALGGHTMAGFTQGLLGGENGAQAALGRIGAGLRRTGAGLALGAASAAVAASPANIDHRPPLAFGAGGGGGGATYNITIHAPAGAPAQDIATLVRQEIEQLEHQRRARTRAELSDYD